MPTWSTIFWRRQHAAKQTRGLVIQSDGVVLDGRQRVQVDGYVVHLSAREPAATPVTSSAHPPTCPASLPR
jgi:hypothetical protein